MKPFKPLTIIRDPGSGEVRTAERPQKRRRISQYEDTSHVTEHQDGSDDARDISAAASLLRCQTKAPKKFAPPSRKPLHEVINPNPSLSSNAHSRDDDGVEGYYSVLWRKFTTKKNKTWDGDGILSVSNGYAVLHDLAGKTLGKTPCSSPLLVGSQLSIGGREIEVETMIPKQDYIAGRPWLQPKAVSAQLAPRRLTTPGRKPSENEVTSEKFPTKKGTKPSRPVPVTHVTKTNFKPVSINGVPPQQPSKQCVPEPRHDPDADGALVMKRPKVVPRGKQIVDVVVDPLLSRRLREHQRVGVSFLYECVMGMKDYEGEGAILADEMGVGKTLQTIALLWTLMKQNPVYGDPPVVKKALIVCPVTLINNWRKEFNKWLGNERIGVFVAGNKHTRLTDFTKGRSYNVMIIGYERLRSVQADLQQGTGIDLVIADEGHRLKTAQNKSAMAIKSLNTERRIILSGTPVQNDLAEFYTMVDFVNPGLLSKYSTFKREFEMPILKGRQPEASAKEIEKGKARSEELSEITGMFILRRTADILAKYLPPKTEYVVFCKPTKAQLSIYRTIIGSPLFSAALGVPTACLELITVLKKVCNSPTLLLKNLDKGEELNKKELLGGIPSSLLKSPGASGKLQVLDSLLHQIRNETDEKVVLVSNYTSTMDVLGSLLTSLSYSFLRLDGSTPSNKRQEIVDRFNRKPPKDAFVLLLSAKAGGMGLNLIGASRLILFDLDWNPATDLQAMARIHRDGQKRPCHIYRLLTQGALDEKIFQRQVNKTGLAESIIDGKKGVSGFTRDDLRNIFSLDDSEDCQTHRLLDCDCGGEGIPACPEGETEEPLSPRNDLATLFAESKPEYTAHENVEVIRMEDDEFVDEKRACWMKASEYDAAAAVESPDGGTGKKPLLSLMQYSHFDTALIDRFSRSNSTPHDGDIGEEEEQNCRSDPLETILDDVVLRNVLREDGRRVGFVFMRTTT